MNGDEVVRACGKSNNDAIIRVPNRTTKLILFFPSQIHLKPVLHINHLRAALIVSLIIGGAHITHLNLVQNIDTRILNNSNDRIIRRRRIRFVQHCLRRRRAMVPPRPPPLRSRSAPLAKSNCAAVSVVQVWCGGGYCCRAGE